MSGRLIDLSQPNVAIPDPVAVDTNVIVALFQAFFPGSTSRQATQAASLFNHVIHANQQVVLTGTGYSELLHIAVRDR